MQRVKNIHLVGIGGCGMSALAKVLHDMGYTVTGSDLREGPNTLRLREEGVKVYIGHDASQARSADLIVFSSAVPEDNVELAEGGRRGIQIIKRAQMLSWIIEQSKIKIAVAGTHGKTTVTAMIAKILDYAGFAPTYFIGCDMDYVEGNAKLGDGKFAVTEADESDSSFLYFSPSIEVVTNIEEDHLEHFGNLEKLIETFEKFIGRLGRDGWVVMDGGNANNHGIISKIKSRVITYGLDNKLEWSAKGADFENSHSKFILLHHGKELGEVKLLIPGQQNILNSLAAFAVSFELGLNFSQISGALRTFVGAKRRFQILGEEENVMLVDDYAHHPTEIKATLSAAKSGWPKRRLIAIFQPHRYTRTLFLKDEFATAFEMADKVILTEIYAASEKPIPGISGKTLVESVKNKEVMYIPKKEKIADYVVENLKEGDIILTLGAGDIYTVGKEIFARLRMRKSA